ncbi:MAG: SCP2 sterol-binding domain-containing protein [Nitrososphaerota archaeon]|jgi:putative sterol carrier protein|nr:SCP2 sterol-binding domain-containing protein [Nitrososphaerota archaeon]
MEIKTSQEFFENILSTKFNPEKAKGTDVVIQINLTGNNPSDWVVTIKDQKIQSKRGMVIEPTLTLKTSEENFLELVNGKISAERALLSGKVNFKGDITTALQLKAAGFL